MSLYAPAASTKPKPATQKWWAVAPARECSSKSRATMDLPSADRGLRRQKLCKEDNRTDQYTSEPYDRKPAPALTRALTRVASSQETASSDDMLRGISSFTESDPILDDLSKAPSCTTRRAISPKATFFRQYCSPTDQQMMTFTPLSAVPPSVFLDRCSSSRRPASRASSIPIPSSAIAYPLSLSLSATTIHCDSPPPHVERIQMTRSQKQSPSPLCQPYEDDATNLSAPQPKRKRNY